MRFILADIANGETGVADVLFLVAFILFLIAVVLYLFGSRLPEPAAPLSGVLVAAGLACVALAWLLL